MRDLLLGAYAVVVAIWIYAVLAIRRAGAALKRFLKRFAVPITIVAIVALFALLGWDVVKSPVRLAAKQVLDPTVWVCHSIPGRVESLLVKPGVGLFICPPFEGIRSGCWADCPPLSEWLK